MTEEFVDYESFFVYPKDHKNRRPEDVNIKTNKEPEPNVSSVGQMNVYDQRRFEAEKYTQKSLPSLKSSYGSFYSSKPFSSESEPLLHRNYHFPSYLYGEPIHVNRYRRTQIFLFFYIVFYVSYLIVGSICFQKLEHEIDQEIRSEFRDVRRKFIEEHPDVKG